MHCTRLQAYLRAPCSRVTKDLAREEPFHTHRFRLDVLSCATDPTATDMTKKVGALLRNLMCLTSGNRRCKDIRCTTQPRERSAAVQVVGRQGPSRVSREEEGGREGGRERERVASGFPSSLNLGNTFPCQRTWLFVHKALSTQQRCQASAEALKWAPTV